MPAPAVPGGVLLNLAVEGVLPVLGGIAGAVAAGPGGGLAGVAVGQVVEKGIAFFGKGIVEKWAAWFRRQPPAARQAALAELAELPADQAHGKATAALQKLAPGASPAAREWAAEYLAAIPRAVKRSLVSIPSEGGLTLPPTLCAENSQDLLQLLPTDVPPYRVPSTLPGTEYRLEELIGTGGFGAVYRAGTPSLQYLPLAIKFCLDPAMRDTLLQERSNLERLMRAGGESWSPRIVRLYGYNLDHRTPFLVYEYISGGDLTHWLAACQAEKGRRPAPAEVLKVIVQVAEALAFAHQRGLVHRDLKPANVLVGDRTVKLADFGIGGVVARQAARDSRIGTVAPDRLSLAEQVSLYRGAGTPLYMSQEQRRGEAPDPRHDLYSLGVMWYQLMAGDVTRELHPGWARELEAQFAVPGEQIGLIQRCVGWIKERPRDAGELLRELRGLGPRPTPAPAPAPATNVGNVSLTHTGLGSAPTASPAPVAKIVLPLPTPPAAEQDRSRQVRLTTRMSQLLCCHQRVARLRRIFWPVVQGVFLGVLLGAAGGAVLGIAAYEGLKPAYVEYPGDRYEYHPIDIFPYRNRSKNPASGEKEGLFEEEYKALLHDYDNYAQRRDRVEEGSVVIGAVGGLVLWFLAIRLRLRLRRGAVERAERDRVAKIDVLLAEFPRECQAWGGPPALRDPEAVPDFLRELEAGGMPSGGHESVSRTWPPGGKAEEPHPAPVQSGGEKGAGKQLLFVLLAVLTVAGVIAGWPRKAAHPLSEKFPLTRVWHFPSPNEV